MKANMLALVVVSGVFAGASLHADDTNGAISGTVTGSGGTQPAQEVMVSATGSDGHKQSTLTEADGTYKITGLSAGNYSVQFAPPDGSHYADEYYDNATNPASAASVAVNAGQTAENINASLELGGTITGVVYAPDGSTPLIGGWVGASADGIVWRGAWLAPDGTYEITGLREGSYRVFFRPLSSSPYAYKYSGNAADYDTAATVAVLPDQTTPGVNATLDMGGTITGVVAGANGGVPTDSFLVTAEGVGGGGNFSYAGPGGTYTIYNLPVGNYRVRFDRDPGSADVPLYAGEYYGNVRDKNAATLLTVAAESVTPGIDALMDLLFARISSPQKIAPNTFSLSIAGTPGVSFQLQKSTNLTAWAALGPPTPAVPDMSGTLGTNSLTVTTSAPREFWRLIEVEPQ